MRDETYNTRGDLKKALPGPYYQVLVVLYYLLDALANDKKVDAKLELAGVGALDDVVLTYFDEERTQQKETYFLQLKHAANNEEKLELGDLANKTGKCEIFKYFDDWYFFIKEHEAHQNSKCVYYTNRDFSDEVQKNIYDIMELNERGEYQFSNVFLNSKNSSLYCKIKEQIQKNSVACNQALVDITTAKNDKERKMKQAKIEGNPTYKKAKEYYDSGRSPLQGEEAIKTIEEFLKNHYRMLVGQEPVARLERRVAENVSKYFVKEVDTTAIFNALIVEAWQWFRQLKVAEIWNEESFEAKLNNFHTRFTQLPQEIGRSNAELFHVIEKMPINLIINRQSMIEEIKSWIKDFMLREHNILNIYGQPKVGKTSLIVQYLIEHSELKLGEYLYFEQSDLFFNQYEQLQKVPFLKLFIVDQVCLASNFLQRLTENNSKNSFHQKLIMVTENPIENVPSYKILPLTPNNIIEYLQMRGKSEYVLKFGKKILQLKAIANLQSGGLYNYMQYPEKLKKICDLCKPPGYFKKTKFNPIMSHYMQKGSVDFKPIQLDAEQISPLYLLDEVIRFKEFNKTKCVHYDEDELLEKFQQRYRITENPKFIWINVKDIALAEDDQDLMEILCKAPAICDNEELKSRIKGKNIPILLLGYKDICSKWPQRLINDLLHLPNCVIFTQCNIEQFEGLKFSLRFQDGQYYFEYKNEQAGVLPNGSAVVSYPIENIQNELANLARKPSGLLCTEIVAEGGAGKSTTLKSIYDQYITSDSVKWENRYYHMIYAPLSRLAHLKLNTLSEMALSFLNDTDNEFFKDALDKDLSEKKILFLLDGWDELNGEERKGIESVLKQLMAYQHMVVTTRPNENLFFKAVNRYKLKNFDEKKITEFVYHFFKSDTAQKRADEFSKKVVAFINHPMNRESLKMIGLPLQCYLLCAAWFPRFELSCQDTEVDLPSILTETELYNQFIMSRFRKNFLDQYHANRERILSDAEICTINNHFLVVLQEAGYKQLFFNASLTIEDDYYGNYIRRLGLIDEEAGVFVHKTYAEYFAALYVVNLLLTNKDKAKTFIFEYRYQSHYRLIFNFMARIISNENTILPNAPMCLRDFWKALLQEPRDYIGIAEEELLVDCYKHSNQDKLAEIFGETDLDELNDSVSFQEISTISDQSESQSSSGKSSSELSDSSDDEEMYDFSKVNKDNASMMPGDKIIEFNPPKLSDEVPYVKQAEKVQALPVLSYSRQAKQEAFNWLVETLQSTRSFRVEEACVETLGMLGISTDALKAVLIKYLDRKPLDKRSCIHENIISYFVDLNIEISNIQLTDVLFSKFFDIFFKYSIRRNALYWLGKQTFLKPQLKLLINSLEKASFSTQQKVFNILAKNEKNNNIDYFGNLLKGKAKISNSLQLCCQYVLLENAQFRLNDYMDNVLKLRYNDNNFQIIIELLKPIKALLSKQTETEEIKSIRRKWIQKIYTFALAAVKNPLYKNVIPTLIGELVDYQLDFERMQALLKYLLNPNSDEGFWDHGAVKPSLPHLPYYFSKPWADYLIYKVTHQKRHLRMSLSDLFKPEYVLRFRDDDAQELFVSTCLNIYKKMTQKSETIPSDDDPTDFVKEVKPDIFLKVFLKEWDGKTKDMVFLKKYFTENEHAFVIHSQENSILVYTFDSYQRVLINAEQKDRLLKIAERKTLLPDGIKKPIKSLDQISSQFIIRCQATFFNRDIDRKRKRRQREVIRETFSLETSLLQENKKRRNKEDSDSVKLQHVTEFEAEDMVLQLTLWMSKIEFDEVNKKDARQWFGLQPYEVTGQTGNCLFASIAAFVPHATEDNMRQRAVSCIQNDEQLIERINAGSGQEHLLTMKGNMTYQTLDNYLELMKMSQTWGTAIEVVALARSLQRPIAILTPKNQYDYIIEEDLYRNNDPIFLNYVRQSHYEPLAVPDNKNAMDILNEMRAAIEKRNNEREQNLQQGSSSNMVL